MNRDHFIFRVRVLAVIFILAAFTLILRHLAVVLNYSYYLDGEQSVVVAIVILFSAVGLSANFLYLVIRYLEKIGPGAIIQLQEIKNEWRGLTPLNKLLSISGLLSLPITLITIGNWFAVLAAYLLQK
ncbi:hypothetical protein HY969_04805 [Candidatus Kaiserbacteria bacterium]|nr:hypothetical protein [Candidatus Kaiserbacteria bacterium]